MTFIKKIKELSVINEIIEREQFGDISPIINDLQKIINNLPYDKTIINYNNKTVDLRNISDKEYMSLLKDINFKKSLRLLFKKESRFRKEVLKTFSGKKWLKDRYIITKLFKKLNNNKFKKTIVYDMNGRLDKDVNQLTSDSERVNEITKFLEENGYNFPIFEIGACYKGKTIYSIVEAFEEIKKFHIQNKEIIEKANEYLKNIKNVYDNKYKIVFSLETRAVASQSTNVNWRSCMNLVNGENRQFVGSSIAGGLAVVYLTRVGDYLKIDRPLGRLLIKPMVSEEKILQKTNAADLNDTDIYYHLENLYTTGKYILNKRITDSFTAKVKEIIDEVNDNISADIINKEKDADKQQRKFILNRYGEKEKNYYKDTIDEFNFDAKYADLVKKANQGLDFTEDDHVKLKSILDKIKQNNENKKAKSRGFYTETETLDSNFVNALLKNKKYDYLFKKYDIEVETDTFLIKRIPGIPSIKNLKLNAMSKSIEIDSDEKKKEIEIEELYYNPINGGDNNLTKIDDDSIVKVKKFEYEFNTNRKGDFKIKSNLKALKPPNLIEAEINEKIYSLRYYTDYDSKFIFKPENYLKDEKIKERFKIKIDQSFDKKATYCFGGCEIEFPRRTNNERESFNVIIDKNSIITKFPEKYYLNYNSFNSFNIDYNIINDQAGFLYKNLFELIINFQNDYILKYFKNNNEAQIRKINEIIFSKQFIPNEELDFLNNFIKDTEAKKDFFTKIKKLIPTDIFFTMTVNIDGDNTLNYLKNKSTVYEESESKKFKYEILKNDFYTYLFKIKNICKIFSINFIIIDNSGLNLKIHDNIDEIAKIKPDIYDGQENFSAQNKIDFIHISNAKNEIKINKDVRYLIINNKTQNNNGKIIYNNSKETETVFVENCNLKKLIIKAKIGRLEIKNSIIDSISYEDGFYYKTISINKTDIKKIDINVKDFMNTTLIVTECTSLPEKVIFSNIEILNSNLSLTNVLTKKIEFVHSEIKDYKNLKIDESYEKFSSKITINHISQKTNVELPIYIKDSENNDKILKILNNDENIYFTKSIEIELNDEAETIITDKILSILKLSDKKIFEKEIYDNISILKENLPKGIERRLDNSPIIQWFLRSRYEILDKALNKKRDRSKKIKETKPIGVKIKELKTKFKNKFFGDSFISYINRIDSKTYFD